jgi:hypothetical protein
MQRVGPEAKVSTMAPAAAGPSSRMSSRRPSTGCRPTTSKWCTDHAGLHFARLAQADHREADGGEIADGA